MYRDTTSLGTLDCALGIYALSLPCNVQFASQMKYKEQLLRQSTHITMRHSRRHAAHSRWYKVI